MNMMTIKPRLMATTSDPRCIDVESGTLIGKALDDHRDKTGETIPVVSAAIGIGKESLRAYQRGHQVPTDASRAKLEKHLGLPAGSLKPKGAASPAGSATTTHHIEGGDLVIIIRIPLTTIA